MSGVTVQQMADRVAQLMEERLRIKGRGLGEKLRRGGRYLPRKVRTQAAYLAQAAAEAQVPRLQMRLDSERIATAYDACVRYLKPLGQGARRKAALLNFITSVAATLLVTAALVIVVLVWRGYV
jgi:hypothetical protein